MDKRVLAVAVITLLALGGTLLYVPMLTHYDGRVEHEYWHEIHLAEWTQQQLRLPGEIVEATRRRDEPGIAELERNLWQEEIDGYREVLAEPRPVPLTWLGRLKRCRYAWAWDGASFPARMYGNSPPGIYWPAVFLEQAALGLLGSGLVVFLVRRRRRRRAASVEA